VKLHFEPDLGYQQAAIEAVCDLFHGQETCRTEFTITRPGGAGQLAMPGTLTDLGIGNQLTLLDDDILRNLAAVQLQNGLRPSTSLVSGDFTIEMETGTGKTYVYLRTIFELNKRFGFTKFVIVVPSVAIKEGVYKTLQMTEEHFRALYTNTPYEYFLYDSTRLGQVRNFATSSQIQIMVVTVGAINKRDVNNLYKDTEKTGGEKPIDLIRATKPIVIVDEPQSVDGGLSGAGKAALDAMDPLCTLRYSATHVDKHHMIYRLDTVDAYEQRLVKQIEIASAIIEDGHNKPYMRLLSVHNTRGDISARVELDVATASGVRRREMSVHDGDQLEELTGRALYSDCRIGEIRVAKASAYLELRVPGDEVFLKPGQAWGDVDVAAVQREMIRRTIKEHFDKELRLRPLGIKVLSLFFVDAVEKYRQYDTDGNVLKGMYAHNFEEEFRRLAKHPDYQPLFHGVDITQAAEAAHDGYFSIDKRGSWTNTDENNQTNRENAERAYTLIMRDKEQLLSFETPLRFIFSHSALREGWDNPNVFQICTLREIQTERERRQTIGRGLRLCVNQDGERLRGFDVNTLTVIATESYEQFAEQLQKEIEADTGIRFGIVEEHQFAGIAVTNTKGQAVALGREQSTEIWVYLKAQGYLDAHGKVQDALKRALKDGTLAVPDSFVPQFDQITAILRKAAGRLDIKNANERRHIPTRQAVLHSLEFKALWDRMKHKTTYRLHFDNTQLVANCIGALRDSPPISKTRLQWRKADIAIGKAGVEATEREGAATVVLDEADITLPDVLTELQDRTQLTRRTIAQILVDSRRLSEFKRNPQQFIELAAETINRCKRLAVVDGIKYQRLGDKYYYAQELFEKEELTGYLKHMLASNKSVYEQIVYDSDTEAGFAQALEHNSTVKVYAKLPGWFTVPTPLGSYNPDWAVLVQTENEERLYFVVETKGSPYTDDLRLAENAKIHCGMAHFEALASGDSPAKYIRAHNIQDMLAYVKS
jgi:type III restriction enzyme